jgi:hypothetical protein
MKLLGAKKSFKRIASLARPVRLLALALPAVVLGALAIAIPLRGR